MNPRRQAIALEGTGCLTHREIGERLGITGARVMQIEQQALRKLRDLMRAKGLTTPDAVRP